MGAGTPAHPPSHRHPPGWNSPDSKTPPSASGAMRSNKPQVKACRSSEACADSTMPLKSRQDCEWRPPASSESRLYSESSSGSNLPSGDPPVAVQRMLRALMKKPDSSSSAVAACDVGDLQAEVVAVEDSPLQKRRKSRGEVPVDQAWTAHRFSNRVSSHFAVASARPAFNDHRRSASCGRSCRASSGSSLWLQSESVP